MIVPKFRVTSDLIIRQTIDGDELSRFHNRIKHIVLLWVEKLIADGDFPQVNLVAGLFEVHPKLFIFLERDGLLLLV